MLSLFAERLGLIRNDVREISGSGAPVDGTTGLYDAGPGSLYFDYTNKILYMNNGTKAAPVWVPVLNGSASGSANRFIEGTITSANITGTGAGQLGHANGVILVPAPGAGKINELISATLINDFSVAAYTGGGNTTVNIGGGGAALTGLINAAGFIQSAADKIIEYVPLAATILTYTDNNPINLVTAAAPTNPGTAAGVFRYKVTYRVITTGL